MTDNPLEALSARIAPLQASRPLGHVTALRAGHIEIAGLSRHVSLGDEVRCRGGTLAEVVAIHGERIDAVPCGDLSGHEVGALVEVSGDPTISPCDTWLGRIVDPFGNAIDGRGVASGPPLPIRHPPPEAGTRRGFGDRLATGYVALDTLLPIVEGQRMGIFAGSGVGKSRLLGDLAQTADADVVVVALIGERGREVAGFARDVLGEAGMGRTIIVAATSDRPANVRRRTLPAALTVAERFRAKGARVLFLCDSLTRHAEAFRDLNAASDDRGGGVPRGLVSELAGLIERAGPGGPRQTAITALFTVLVAGSDMEEPVADTARGLLDGHIILSRDIAERGQYPAIDALASVSRALPGAATKDENAVISKCRLTLELFRKNELMVSSGLYEKGGDPALDSAIQQTPAIQKALTDRTGSIEESFAILRKALG
ncbi:hypothetical protein [Jannaschia aquimarina]|uniref:FliI protein n=1 Tax=Jannaschia aquimarina TaxID=935700 RepID=A0A0D1E9I6_9RHOB|nr:hypothetical protein [Jannaschia aquimarina]KIT14304.1 Flagellum-specific ATP synthase [Jannaschia aquimarina]SNS50461.1 flagellum-specific ATP synthase [Jannaschia aquimarina]